MSRFSDLRDWDLAPLDQLDPYEIIQRENIDAVNERNQREEEDVE